MDVTVMSADILRWLVIRSKVVSAHVMNRSEISAAGLSMASLWDTCRDASHDTALTLRRLVLSYQRNAFERSRSLRLVCFPKSERALHNTIVSSST